MNNYRIHRIDSKNIAIQRKRGKRWVSVSYHGNSHFSLISGLFELIMAQHTPKDEKLLYALEDIRRDVVLGMEKVEKLVREYYGE